MIKTESGIYASIHLPGDGNVIIPPKIRDNNIYIKNRLKTNQPASLHQSEEV